MFKKGYSAGSIFLALLMFGMVLANMGGVAGAALTDGLVAYYPFNGNANDESGSGNGNNGVVHGATLTTDRFGNANKAYSFNNSYIEIADSNSLDIGTNSYTTVAWIKTNDVSTQGRIFSKGASGCEIGYMMRLDATTHSITIENSNTKGGCYIVLTSSTLIDDNKWHFVVAVVERSSGAKIYIDGKIDASTNKDTSGLSVANGLNAKIGMSYINPMEPFNGSIDDVRIYNRALSDAEVQQLYTEGDSTTNTLTIYRTGSGTVTSNPSGINCGLVCSASFGANTPVTLTATPDSGSTFS
ncbi:LamG domain protein jellyroll fold domain protein, partial [Candidatus Magnetobacterium bavaricum]